MRRALTPSRISTVGRCPMPSESTSRGKASSVAPTTPISQSADGSVRKTSYQAIGSARQPRPCAWCGATIVLKPTDRARKKFCNPSCSAKWRMSQPEHKAKVHTPEVAKKRGEKKRAWFAAGSPEAEAQRERFRRLNPTDRPEVREKISRTLKAMHHEPSVRGGNGHGLTGPQRMMLAALGPNWRAEYALSLGPRKAGYPTHYKLDLANPALRIAIEVDGLSHHSRRHLDAKKDTKLASLGWIVLRFSNQDILTWSATGMPMDGSISTTLARHGIHLSP